MTLKPEPRVDRFGFIRPGAAVLAVLFTFGCGRSSGRDPSTTDGPLGQPTGEVVVFAAASLTEGFTALSEGFAQIYPDVNLVFSFAASGELAAQISQGAPVDVLATADTATMTRVTEDGAAAPDVPQIFATNSLEIITVRGNPLGVRTLADLARDDLIVVRCSPEVPCGGYTDRMLVAAGVTLQPASLEQNVKAVVSKVTTGEADAGIVYATDVLAAGTEVAGVAIDPSVNVRAEYPIAVIANAENVTGAVAFVEFVRSPAGAEILQRFGFGAP